MDKYDTHVIQIMASDTFQAIRKSPKDQWDDLGTYLCQELRKKSWFEETLLTMLKGSLPLSDESHSLHQSTIRFSFSLLLTYEHERPTACSPPRSTAAPAIASAATLPKSPTCALIQSRLTILSVIFIHVDRISFIIGDFG
ncbi:hypothetical protein JTE90_018867 [Oedothorax gibbosus]|uniref:Uncharacterized protein n=1 Tax=Oedothorax gibbosus TaxID=931172 RepID=A0AAV6TV16_9ARAC|nr:hypothetical protein JTE90_018867 [Oedothorax gibbosus]